MNKEYTNSDSGVEVDISSAVESYVAEDVRHLLPEEEEEEPSSSDTHGTIVVPDFNESGGGVDLGLSDAADFLTNEYPEGLDAVNLKEMFIENAKTPNIFANIKIGA